MRSILIVLGVNTLFVYLGASSVMGHEACGFSILLPDRGLARGCTYFDLQSYGSLGRQIAIDPTFHMLTTVWTDNQGSWSGSPILGSEIPSVTIYDPNCFCIEEQTEINLGGGYFPPYRSGFPNVAPLQDGTAPLVFHWSENDSTMSFKPWAPKNLTPGLVDYWGPVPLQDSVWIDFSDSTLAQESFAWPKIALTDNGPTQVTHVLLSQWRSTDETENTLNYIIYTRRIGHTGNDWSKGVPVATSRQYRSAVIATAPNSSRVSISWIGPRGDGTAAGEPIPRFSAQLSSEFDSDLYVMTSDDAGATWNQRINVTQRPDSLPGGFAPHSKVTQVFDNTEVLHVVWQSLKWNGYGVAPRRSARMFHWSESQNSIRVVADAVYENSLCTPGFGQLNIDNPQLSFCDGKLYVTYSEFASPWHNAADDCGARAFLGDPVGAANGELYVTVSGDGGFTWDNPRSLTQSYSPDCDTINGNEKPPCASEVWHSATRYGIDGSSDYVILSFPDFSSNLGGYAGSNFLFVRYIDDHTPGAAVVGEGGWTQNDVPLFMFGCVDEVSGSLLASDLPEPIKAPDSILISGTDTTITWILENSGDVDISDLSVTLSAVSPPGHVTLTGFGNSLLSGENNADTGFITLNAQKALELPNASALITVSGSFPTSPRNYNISYTVTFPVCCTVAGDFDDDGLLNIGDVTSGIAFIFSGGAAPVCCPSADFDQSGAYNIGDVTSAIAFIFAGGPPPACGPEDAVCGN